MSFKKKLQAFLGIEKYSPFVKSYYEKTNVKSGLYLSCVVIALELWMLCSVCYNQLFSSEPRSKVWLLQHVPCYFILLLCGIALLALCLISINGKKIGRKLNLFVKVAFSVVCILFGLYISWLDYKKGEQFITLVTMTIFVFCYLQWRPIYTIIFLTTTFGLFYIMCNAVLPTTYATKVNLFIIWIAIAMASIDSYHQKIKEAKKEEKLEEANDILLKLSISDEITGISNMTYFISQTLSELHDEKIDVTKMLFLFMDIEHFKNYNEKYGFIAGNEFLKHIGQTVEKVFENSTTAHFSNDNFVVFTKDENVIQKLNLIRREVKKCDSSIMMDLKIGSYRPRNRDCLPIVACDHARYACNSLKKQFEHIYLEYNDQMDLNFYRKQYIINNIDKAIEKDYIKVFYQPLINAQTGKLCGLEALARWDDPEYGFLMPGLFIQTLEEYHQIHKLDMYILNQVCKDIKEVKDKNLPSLPVSLNFSRSDFDVMDLTLEVENCLKFYEIDKSLIHVEITETALADNDDKLQKSLEIFRKSGYALWLDDFGSGYSGLNVLKEYEFDVMKIDMKFLQHFAENKKAKVILRNIIKLAKDIGMETLTEGVETEEAKEFLKEIGCDRLQGYLFGKPMPKLELVAKIQDGTYIPEQIN